MAEIFDYFIRSEHDISSGAPSLSLVGSTPCIAWKGVGNQYPNVMPIRRNPDGSVWFDTGRKLTLTFRIGGGLALTSVNPPGGVLMWSHDHDPAELFGQLLTPDLGVGDDVGALGQSSQYAPALGGLNGTAFMAWTGEDQRLNVAPLAFGDGWEFPPERKFTSPETSEYEPALGWRPAPNRLYLAWTGEGDGELNFMHCDGGLWTDPAPFQAVFHSATKRTISSETSDAGPSIYVVGVAVHLAYRGSGNRNINHLIVNADDLSTIRKDISGHTTPHKPAYASFYDRHWIAYTGDDDHLYLGRVAAP